MTREQIEAHVEETCMDCEIVLADGFEDAFLGVQRTFASGGIRFHALYSLRACVAVLVERDGMTDCGALEFLEFNAMGAYVGVNTPSFLLDLE